MTAHHAKSPRSFTGSNLSCLCSAGCFAAATGFLLDFTIREHPPAAKHSRSRASSGVGLPLAPDQHRLTDDGEGTKQANKETTDLQNKTQTKDSEAASSSSQGPEDEGPQNGVQGTPQDLQPMQRLAAQIKVMLLLLLCLLLLLLFIAAQFKIRDGA